MDILNTQGKSWIPFSEYVQGMIAIKNDPAMRDLVPMDVPNRFQLISLLIDTPINEQNENLITDKLMALEKVGINMLTRLGSPIQTKTDIAATLQTACAGRLHYLTDEQRTAVRRVHNICMAQVQDKRTVYFSLGFSYISAINNTYTVFVW